MKKQEATAPTQAEQTQSATSQPEATQTYPTHIDVRVKPTQTNGKIVAFASMTINKCFGVEGIKVVNGKNGLFVDMPSHKDSQGEYRSDCYPVTADFHKQVKEAVLSGYEQALTQMQTAAQTTKQNQSAQEMQPTEPAMSMSM